MTSDDQQIHEQLDRIEDCEQRLASEGLAEWMDATGTTVADYLGDNRNALDLDEDDATEMGPAAFRPLVDLLDEAVEAIEAEAIDNPLAPHPSSPRSAEQRDFRAAAGF